MTTGELPAVRDYLISLSNQAGELLKQYFQSQDFNQHIKGAGMDVVTQADLEVDNFLRKQLSEKFPELHLMTEETTSGDYRFLRKTDWVCIIDSLDGTINFTRKNPHFGISIGIMHKGSLKLCVAHLPMKGETYWADAETDGAYCNGEMISVSRISDMKQMVVACDWSNNALARKKMLRIISKLNEKTRRIKCQGSPVADLCLLAKGDIDAYVHTRLRPWDITPAYIVQKAGGKVVNFKRSDWDIFRLDILATNKLFYEDLSQLIPFKSSLEIK